MPFSWDQVIPGQQQTYKQKTISLYIDENRRLDGAGGVREYMKEHYKFDKRRVLFTVCWAHLTFHSVSTYRREFPKWGIKKNDYPTTLNRSSQWSFDSGYVTHSNRSSTTKSGIDFTSPTKRQSGLPSRRSSFLHRLSSGSRFSLSRPSSFQPDACISPAESYNGFAQASNEDFDENPTFSPTQISPTFEQSLATIDEKLAEFQFSPPHAHPSTCTQAGVRSEASDVGLLTCSLCGATKLHHLASISRRTDIALFKEVAKSNRESISQADNDGNLSIHFAAGAGASLEQLEILHNAGAHVGRLNHAGQNILHLVDPIVYGSRFTEVLQYAVVNGLGFSQRDSHGKTPLHYFFARNVTLNQVYDLVDLLQAEPHSMSLVDRQGNTPFDVLKDTWQDISDCVNIPLVEEKLTTCNIPLVSRQKYKAPEAIPELYDLGKMQGGDESKDILDVINRSEHEPFYQGIGGRNVLHALAAFSFHANDPLQLLDCLKARLDNRHRIALDVNQYDADGSPPLHAFLSATFDIGSNLRWNVSYMVPECVELLLQHGADPTLRDRNGNTALHLACSRGRFECSGKIVRHLHETLSKEHYVHWLSAQNDRGESVVAFAESSMTSKTSEANARRHQCIGFVREALGQPKFSFMPFVYATDPALTTARAPASMAWSATLPDHSRKNSSESSRSRPNSGHLKPPSWPTRMSVEISEFDEKSFFED